MGENVLPPVYDFSRHDIKVGDNKAWRTSAGTIQGTVLKTYRTFFVVRTPGGYCTTVARWHFLKNKEAAE
jgi:hypothetical protein